MKYIGNPLGDRVLVEALPKNKEITSESGFFIPESATTEDVKITTVVAVGNGIFTQSGTLIPMSVKPGDKVVLPPYHQGHEIKIDGVDYIILRESELLMIL